MSQRDPTKPGMIIPQADDRESRRSPVEHGPIRQSRMGIVACVLPFVILALTYVVAGVIAGGFEQSPLYLGAMLTLLFSLGVGAGMGVGSLGHPRRKKLASILGILLNLVVFAYLALLSVISQSERSDPGLDDSGDPAPAEAPVGSGSQP